MFIVLSSRRVLFFVVVLSAAVPLHRSAAGDSCTGAIASAAGDSCAVSIASAASLCCCFSRGSCLGREWRRLSYSSLVVARLSLVVAWQKKRKKSFSTGCF